MDIRPSDLDIAIDRDEWRLGQLEVGLDIAASSEKVVILQAPTGFGKSLTHRIPGKIHDTKTLILNRTIAHLDKYAEDGVEVLYGRDKYICNRWPLVSAAQGICIAGEYCALMNGGCDYYMRKDATLEAQTSSITYAFFFREANWYGKFSAYPIIVCDEGHAVPDELTNSFTVRILKTDLYKLTLAQ